MTELKEEESKYHFDKDLIDWLVSNGNHEIATHTFSHFYCLESGQNKEEFQGANEIYGQHIFVNNTIEVYRGGSSGSIPGIYFILRIV